MGSPNGSFINGRVFDDLNQQIQFHDFNLQVAYGGPIGGKVEAIFGDDANVTNSWPRSQLDGAPSLNGTGSALSGPDIDLTQAYLSLSSGQFTGIVGRFETLAGAEVIESPSDLEFSRSILFGYAVPFTHTGGRLTWAMNSNISFIVGLNKGWDTTGSLNAPYNNFPGAAPYNDTSSLTFEGGAIWNPSKYFSATLDGYTGQTEEGYAVAPCGPGAFVACPAPRPVKSLIDNVLTWKPTGSLTFIVNTDYGTQTNSALFFPGSVAYGIAKWGGVAGYASYALSGQWTASLRGEIFEDYGGQRSGITQTWNEGTVTLQWAPNSNFMVRGEVRGDKSNQFYFAGVNGIFKTNTQFGIETILKWP